VKTEPGDELLPPSAYSRAGLDMAHRSTADFFHSLPPNGLFKADYEQSQNERINQRKYLINIMKINEFGNPKKINTGGQYRRYGVRNKKKLFKK
jgi:hypothetical protein